MNILKDRNTIMSLDKLSNISYSEANSINEIPAEYYLVKFFIIGNIKGAF